MQARFEVHWRHEFVDSPRVTAITHVLNFEVNRTERTVLVPAKVALLPTTDCEAASESSAYFREQPFRSVLSITRTCVIRP